MIVWQAPQPKKSSALLIIDPETMEEVRKFALNAYRILECVRNSTHQLPLICVDNWAGEG